jgi:putative membrane protein
MLKIKKLKSFTKTYFTGFAMGSADLVPGVSGGTVAFIFGIYEKLISSIKTITGKTLKLLLKLKIKKAIKETPLDFLIPLGLGLVSAVLVLTSLIEYLLHNQAIYLWSAFFGFVLASVVIVGKKIKKWTTTNYIFAIFAASIAFYLAGAVPLQTPANPLAFFISGAIAICAMIMPGISGSFMLIIMGKYEQVISAVTNRDFMTLGIFILGAILGLALFSRLLSYLFKNHHNATIAFLTGFMLGSLRKIWPFKMGEANVLPEKLDGQVLLAIGFCVAAALLISFAEKKSDS